jgi:DNA-binding beta-propeller fold protein YncE
MSNGLLIVDLGTGAVTSVDTGVWNAMGPGAVATYNNLAFVANQMTAGITVVDVAAGKVVRTFPVDPGPRALAINAARNQLLVLAEGTGTLDIVDLNTYAVTARINAGDTDRQGSWTLPVITSMNPNTAAAGSTFTLTITGSNLQSVRKVEFDLMGMQPGGGMMGGGGFGGGMMGGQADAAITAGSVQINSAGTQLTVSVQILATAPAGTRQVRLNTDQGVVMGPMWNSFFNVSR